MQQTQDSPFRRLVGRSSIQFKIGLMVLAGLAGVTLMLSWLLLNAAHNQATVSALAGMNRSNQLLAEAIDQLSAQASADLLLARQNPAIDRYISDSGDGAERQAALPDLHALLSYLESRYAAADICLAAPAAAAIADCVQAAGAASPAGAVPLYFRSALGLGKGEVYQSALPYVSPRAGRWVIALATPLVRPDGTKAGVFHVEVPLSAMAAPLAASPLPGAHSFLLTRDGRVLAHPAIDALRSAVSIDVSSPERANFPPVTALGQAGFAELTVEMTADQPGEGAYVDRDETYRVSYQPVHGGHWIVATVLPQSVIDQAPTDLKRGTILIAAPVLVLAWGLVMAYASSLVGPLRTITETLRTLGGDAGSSTVRLAVKSGDELGELAQAFNQMADALQASQRQVASRTRALAATAEVSRRLSTILDARQLVREVVDQLQQTFNYYHVHVYLFDEARENMVLMAGSGEAGAALLARGHLLPRGRGLVGRAAETNLMVLVPDVSTAIGWLPNPLLPETRSELAVPIAVGGLVLGVLDVQHNVIGGLGQEDADLIQSIASQVAIALQNARSYQQTQRQASVEALINTIGQRIEAAPTVESAMQVAVRELGRALGAPQTRVRLTANEPVITGPAAAGLEGRKTGPLS